MAHLGARTRTGIPPFEPGPVELSPAVPQESKKEISRMYPSQLLAALLRSVDEIELVRTSNDELTKIISP
jgi:hypothetical protein